MTENLLRQPNLFSSELPESPRSRSVETARAGVASQQRESAEDANAIDGSGRPSIGRTRSAVWLRRLDLFMRVVVRLYLGLLLIALPWMHFFDDNQFFLLYPRLGEFCESGAVRGIVSGLGLLNVWIAASDAIHFRDSEV